MKSPNWTPGPWQAKERHANYKGFVVLHDTGSGLRRVDSDGIYENSANARLIAAAPDLYEALQTMLDSSCELPQCGPCTKARQALARARGEDR